MKLFTVMFFAFLSFSILCAQANKDYDGVKPEVYKGSKSLVFSYTPFQSDLRALPAGSYPQMNGNNLNEMQIGGIGFKYFASDQLSLLFSLGLGSSSTEVDNESSSTTDYSQTYYGLSVDVDYHLPNLYSISTYIGGNINYGSMATEHTLKLTSSSTTDEFSSSAFGLGVNIGFDWFFTEGISLGGKYTLGFKSLSEPEYTTSSGSSSDTQKGPSESTIGTGVGTIVISVHF